MLDISVWKSPELSRTVPVRPDGKVSLPLVNDIKAAGLTPSRLRQELTRRLSEFVPRPEVAVIVREVHSAKVVGRRRRAQPGPLRSAQPGHRARADRAGAGIHRLRRRVTASWCCARTAARRSRIPFQYRKITEVGTEQDNFFVESGDIIVVP